LQGFGRRSIEVMRHRRGEVGKIAPATANRYPSRGERRDRITGGRSRLQDGYRLPTLGDFEALTTPDSTQVDAEVLAQFADPDSLHDAQM
jgi:hypothetical protein